MTPPLSSSRPSSTSSSSSDAGVKRRSFSVRPSCRPRPDKRASITRQTPSTSITMTKYRGASLGTSPRDPAPCWETTTWWSSNRSSLSRGSSPPAPHVHQHSPQQEVRRSSQGSWSSWSRLRWRKSQLWLLEQRRGQLSLQLPLVARRGHSHPTGHSVLESCSVSASQKVLWCVQMGHNHQPSPLTLSPAGMT